MLRVMALASSSEYIPVYRGKTDRALPPHRGQMLPKRCGNGRIQGRGGGCRVFLLPSSLSVTAFRHRHVPSRNSWIAATRRSSSNCSDRTSVYVGIEAQSRPSILGIRSSGCISLVSMLRRADLVVFNPRFLTCSSSVNTASSPSRIPSGLSESPRGAIAVMVNATSRLQGLTSPVLLTARIHAR